MSAKKAPVNALAVTGIEIATELRSILATVEANSGECSDAEYAALKEWSAAFEVKAENICLAKSSMEAQMAYFKTIEDAARARRKSLENAWEGLKKYLAHLMAETGTTQIKKTDGLFTISLCPGRSKTVIDDEKKLPYAMVEVVEVVRPKTDSIKTALEAGAEVPGAHLETGTPYVTIRAAGASSKE